jgi:hypothetical protein
VTSCPPGFVARFGGHHSGGCFPDRGSNLAAPVVLNNGKVTVSGPARRVIQGMRAALAKLSKMGYGDHRLTQSTTNALPETVEDAGVKTIRWPLGEWVTWTASWSAIAAGLAPVLGTIPAWPLGLQTTGTVIDPSHYAPTVNQAIPAIDSLLDKTKADDEKPWLWIALPLAAAAGVGTSVWFVKRRRRRAA